MRVRLINCIDRASQTASHRLRAHSLQTVAVVPEIVFGIHVFEIERRILAAQQNLVPQHHLVEFVILGLVLGRQIQEQLLHIPIE